MQSGLVAAVALGVKVRSAKVAGFNLEEWRHPPDLALGLHAHASANVVFVLRGGFTQRIDGKDYPCLEGSVLMKRARVAHADRFG